MEQKWNKKLEWNKNGTKNKPGMEQKIGRILSDFGFSFTNFVRVRLDWIGV